MGEYDTMDRPLAINLNVYVEVELTDTGKKIWIEYPFAHPPRIEAAPRDLQLWELMKIFGPHIFNGMLEVPFVGNTIVLRPEQPDGHLIREVETPVAETSR